MINGMHETQGHEASGNNMSPSEKDRLLEVLSLEYKTLRDEVLMRSSGRFQFLGLMTTAAALLATGVGSSLSGTKAWVSAALAILVFGVGLESFWWLGRNIIALSTWIAELEQRISQLVCPGNDQGPLNWETEHQQRSLMERISYGVFSRRP